MSALKYGGLLMESHRVNAVTKKMSFNLPILEIGFFFVMILTMSVIGG